MDAAEYEQRERFQSRSPHDRQFFTGVIGLAAFQQRLMTMFFVMRAVALRDMRTRFFNHGLGFLVVSLWPLGHFGILLAIYHGAGRAAPFGDSLNLFFATGLIPTLLFIYVSRFMSVSLALNRPMMAFPAVHVVDIMIARAFLEVIAAFITLCLVMLIFWMLGEQVTPYDPEQAVLAYVSALLLAVGVGTLAGVISMFFDFFVTVYGLFSILLYVGSGTLFIAGNLPDYISVPLSYNPVLQCVEWMRTAYYESYSDKLLDRVYAPSFGICCLFLGLLLERMFRRRMLE